MLTQVLTYVLFPVAAVLLGGAVAAFRPPGARLRSIFQHFAAGIVFAAVAGELLPEVLHEAAPVPAVIGFALGVGLMLGVKALGERSSQKNRPAGNPAGDAQSAALPWGLIIAVAVDVTVDGLLVGVGFAAGNEAGILVTVALTLEVLFLGLATAAEIGQADVPRWQVLGVVAGLAVLVALGAAVGGALLGGVSGPLLEGILSFGIAALLYLVTEELLVEAHEVEDTPLTAATFFLGFLALMLIEMFV